MYSFFPLPCPSLILLLKLVTLSDVVIKGPPMIQFVTENCIFGFSICCSDFSFCFAFWDEEEGLCGLDEDGGIVINCSRLDRRERKPSVRRCVIDLQTSRTSRLSDWLNVMADRWGYWCCCRDETRKIRPTKLTSPTWSRPKGEQKRRAFSQSSRLVFAKKKYQLEGEETDADRCICWLKATCRLQPRKRTCEQRFVDCILTDVKKASPTLQIERFCLGCEFERWVWMDRCCCCCCQSGKKRQWQARTEKYRRPLKRGREESEVEGEGRAYFCKRIFFWDCC